MSGNIMGRVVYKDVVGVFTGALGDLAAAGYGKKSNALTMILSDSENGLLFQALLLPPGADEASCQKSFSRRGNGG